jgi:hypothetical protein
MRPLIGLLSLLVLGGCADIKREQPEAVAPSVQADIQSQLAAREYRASENGQGLQAPNRAHNLRTYFDASGIRVHDRTAGGSPELLKLALTGVGRGSDLRAVPAGSVHAEDARVEIRRPDLVEWFVNGPDGLEQGFTLAERPAGVGKLLLELRLEGAKAKRRGEALVFETPTGRKLSYGKLVVQDARGEPLAAKLQLAGAGRIAVSVDDAGAAYPIVVDPLLEESDDAMLQGEQPFANLGSSVASAGDVNGDGYADVIVGAPGFDSGSVDEGAALIFLGGPNGIPDAGPLSAQTQLEGNQPSAVLGDSVASAGDVNGDGYADVIVGAPGYDHGQLDEGMALVFLGSASGVADGNPTTAHAQLESDQVGAQFGSSVASAGDVNGDGYADVVVGDPLNDNNNAFSAGAAFVFLGSANGIADGNPVNAHAQLLASTSSAALGTSVASAGDVNGDGYDDLIVSAPGINSTWPGEGFVLIYMGSAQGVTSGGLGVAATTIRGNQLNAHIGDSVASAGDVNGDGYADVIVGAVLYDASPTTTGEAFVFLGSASGVASGPVTTAHAKLSSDQVSSFLGSSVASAGDVNGDGYADVIVSDYGYENEGRAFVYLGSQDGLPSGSSQVAYAQLDVGQAGALFGYSVASAGDVNGDGYADVIVGAQAYENDHLNEGAAFVYLGGATGITPGFAQGVATDGIESNQPGAELGYSVASAGDVNGDGHSDVIVGAPSYDAGDPNEGAAFIFHGRADGFLGTNPDTANTQLESDQPNANLGHSVASAGDVNGDGYGDVIVGANLYDNSQTDEGAAFVFLGSASGVADGNPTSAHAQLESNQAFANLGWSVASAGDVNGDGYSDVIVGAWQYDSGESNEGAAFVFLGSPSGLVDGNPVNAHAQLESNRVSSLLGSSVASAGDVNGDGYADLIVGAMNYANGQAGEGAAFVFHGGASGLADGNPANADTQIESDQAGANLGWAVASAGDVNGDGYADVIVGAPVYTNGQSSEGAAFVFLGSASGVSDGSPGNALAQLESNQTIAEFGGSVASAGDVNGDGFADVIVGSDLYDSGQPNEGAAFVFLGSASGIADGNPTNAHAQLLGGQGGGLLGISVACAGDVDADGFADVIVGALRFDNFNTDEGVVFVFHGSGLGGGRLVLARQKRGDGSGIPVQPWGGAHSGTNFVAELRANHPRGRGRVKAQLQACPSGAQFGDASCTTVTTPTWLTVNRTTPDVLISHTFAGLAEGELYRWRARVLHAPATGPLPANPAHGPWRRPTAQATEADIRLVPEPEALLSLAVGCGALAGLQARRRRSRSR